MDDAACFCISRSFAAKRFKEIFINLFLVGTEVLIKEKVGHDWCVGRCRTGVILYNTPLS